MPDTVTFTAACPACGEDTTWTSWRRDAAGEGREFYRPDGAPYVEVHGDCTGEATA